VCNHHENKQSFLARTPNDEQWPRGDGAIGLFPKQCEQQSEDDADEDGGDDGKVESEILFSNDDISGKSSDPRNFFSKQKKNPNQDDQNTQQDEHFA